MRSITALNKALVDKWIWRFWNENNNIWRSIILCKWFNYESGDMFKIKNDTYGANLWKTIWQLDTLVL